MVVVFSDVLVCSLPVVSSPLSFEQPVVRENKTKAAISTENNFLELFINIPSKIKLMVFYNLSDCILEIISFVILYGISMLIMIHLKLWWLLSLFILLL